MNRYLLLLISLILFSCSKNEETPLTKNQVLSADCLKEITTEPHDQRMCYFDSLINCEIIEFPEYYRLAADDKEWLKYYCLNDFDKVFFHNENGEETFIEISEHIIGASYSNYYAGKCPNDSTRFKSYCYTSESASLSLRIPAANTSIRLNLNTSLTGVFPDDLEQTFDIFAFSYDRLNGLLRHFIIYPEMENSFVQSFFPEIEILGKTFVDVFTTNDSNITPDPEALKFFYNKEFGIVSFIDNNGTQWVLND